MQKEIESRKQRTRVAIQNDSFMEAREQMDTYRVRQARLQLEVLLDIRDLLYDFREWLPSAE